jgi:rfaE bifunctional protein kinase chain/domain
VLILEHEGEELVPGGGANAIFNVRALGGRPLPVGVVGDDDNGRALLDLFAGHDVATEGILVQPGYRTPCKTRILAGARHAIKQQIVRYDIGDALRLADRDRATLGERLAQLASSSRVLLVSDYGQGGVQPELVAGVEGRPELLRLADSRHRLKALENLDGATPNEEELDMLVPGSSDDVLARGELLRRQLDARFLLLTRGSEGMILFEEGGASSIPVHGTDQVADVTGAGDTVIGAFALASAAGASPLEAALLANYAGGIVVMKLGTATAAAGELREAIRQDPKPREELQWVAC